MPRFVEKFKKLLIFLIPLVLINSCTPQCVQSDEFNTIVETVDANPVGDVVTGSYNSTTGGQVANWHNTGLITDGEPITVEISGGWTAWGDGDDNLMSNAEFTTIPNCNMCAKEAGVDNCICASGQTPVPEINPATGTQFATGTGPGQVDCTNPTTQANAAQCTCTKSSSGASVSVNDSGVYYIPLDYYNKDGSVKVADQQQSCQFSQGEGLYIGLFGPNGNTMPTSVYHLYSTVEVCDIPRNSQGLCVDSNGVDQTKYYYQSPNNTILPGSANGAMFPGGTAGQVIKLIIDDRYYSDNSGSYNVTFLGGVETPGDNGLLEYIVGTVEDSVLGKINPSTNTRSGGAVKMLYNAIVQNTYFIQIIQLCLIIYVTIFGIFVLAGTIQISKKELMSRSMKISLVIFFTTPTSWYFYNQIVVGFFKDSMDAIIAMFMNASDSIYGQTSLIIIAEQGRANSLSSATRFSYIDDVIKMLFSNSVTQKIWSLFFGEWFGFLYIPMIYALIFCFVYIMLLAAFAYITALLKLVFVLALGPLFMIASLYGRTDPIFKRWISFMAARSFEIICLFLVIYMFLIQIDLDFTKLLSFSACTTPILPGLGLFNFNVLQSQNNGLATNYGLIYWMTQIFKIASLLFILKLVMEKIPGLASSLVVINSISGNVSGSANFQSEHNSSAFSLGRSVLGSLTGGAYAGVKNLGGKVAGIGMSGAGMASRAIGLDKAWKAVREVMPFRAPTTRMRDHKIDSVIKEQQNAGRSAGHTGAALDQYVREKTFATLGKASSMFLGANNPEAIAKRLEQKLVKEPLRQAIKDEAKKLKAEKGAAMPLGKRELREAMRERIAVWAEKNSAIGKGRFLELLDQKDTTWGVISNGKNFQSLVEEHGALSSSEAAKIFAGNEEGRNRYLQHLQDQQFERQAARTGNFFATLQRHAAYNPKIARSNFLRKVGYEEARQANQGNYGVARQVFEVLGANTQKDSSNPLRLFGQTRRVNVLDKLLNVKKTNQRDREAQRKVMVTYLAGGGYQKDRERISAAYVELIKGKSASELVELERQKEKELDLIDKKRDHFMEVFNAQVSAERSDLAKMEIIDSLGAELFGMLRELFGISKKQQVDRYKKSLEERRKILSRAIAEKAVAPQIVDRDAQTRQELIKKMGRVLKPGTLADSSGSEVTRVSDSKKAMDDAKAELEANKAHAALPAQDPNRVQYDALLKLHDELVGEYREILDGRVVSNIEAMVNFADGKKLSIADYERVDESFIRAFNRQPGEVVSSDVGIASLMAQQINDEDSKKIVQEAIAAKKAEIEKELEGDKKQKLQIELDALEVSADKLVEGQKDPQDSQGRRQEPGKELVSSDGELVALVSQKRNVDSKKAGAQKKKAELTSAISAKEVEIAKAPDDQKSKLQAELDALEAKLVTAEEEIDKYEGEAQAISSDIFSRIPRA